MLACFIQLENVYNACDRGPVGTPRCVQVYLQVNLTRKLKGLKLMLPPHDMMLPPPCLTDCTVFICSPPPNIKLLQKTFGLARVASAKFQVKLEDVTFCLFIFWFVFSLHPLEVHDDIQLASLWTRTLVFQQFPVLTTLTNLSLTQG